MTIATVAQFHPGIRSAAESHKAGTFMYAIAFDMDTESLQQHYGAASYNNAYADIRKLLTQTHGFTWQQGSVYFGGSTVNAVTCVLAVMDLAVTFPWFALSVRDIRMLRIEEFNDLMPAVQQAVQQAAGG
jgi:virulence-associated protein VapD